MYDDLNGFTINEIIFKSQSMKKLDPNIITLETIQEDTRKQFLLDHPDVVDVIIGSKPILKRSIEQSILVSTKSSNRNDAIIPIIYARELYNK